MSQKVFAAVLCALLLAPSNPAEAQQPGKVPRIGYLSPGGDPKTPGRQLEAFRQGLRDLGYYEGKNIVIEYRYAEGQPDRLLSLVRELVQLKLDVLVLPALQSIREAKQATKTIPIIMVTTVDPVAAGLVDSLARPGGNITGLTRLTRDLSGKRLELLKEVVPRISCVGVLWDAANAPGQVGLAFKNYETAARDLKIPFESLEVSGPNPDLEGAFREAVKGRLSALITARTTVLVRYPKRIAELAITSRLPSMYEGSEFVDEGGLMSYAASDAESFKRRNLRG